MRLIPHSRLLHLQTCPHSRCQLLRRRPRSLDLTRITSAFLAICLPLAPKFFSSFKLRSLRSSQSQGYQRHDHPSDLPNSHNRAAAAVAAKGAKKSWTGTGKTAVNSNAESSEFELADTPHIVQRIDISTKYENR